MQIESGSKLSFSARTTMQAAQGLYQAGHITYHRTDSLSLSKQALASMASFIESKYGKNYLQVRNFKTKSAGAQEAHEAIRPSHIEKETAGKNDYEKRLYKLIRNRTLASQMTEAKLEKTVVQIDIRKFQQSISKNVATPEKTLPEAGFLGDQAGSKKYSAGIFEAKGEVILFDGFLKVYGNVKEFELPKLTSGQTIAAKEIVARQTFERPPSRYTEGTLVKKLEELGIGRPSTYASIMTALQVRGYAIKGESEGTERELIELIWKPEKLKLSDHRVSPVKKTTITGESEGRVSKWDPPEANQNDRGTFDKREQTRDPKVLVSPVSRQIVIEKTGSDKGKLIPTPIGELISSFLVDNFKNIVDYKFTANIEEELDLIADAKLNRIRMLKNFYGPFSKEVNSSDGVERYNGAKKLGRDPETGKTIYAKIGKNGGFIQLGDNEKSTGQKPRFAPLPNNITVKTVTLEQALTQLALPALPRSLGSAKDGVELIATSGPFGPYLKADKYNIPLKKHDPYTVTLKQALPLYQAKLDSIIADWDDIKIINGAYGPYVKGPGRRNNAKIPKDIDPKKLTKAQAEKLLTTKPKNHRRPPKRHKTKK